MGIHNELKCIWLFICIHHGLSKGGVPKKRSTPALHMTPLFFIYSKNGDVCKNQSSLHKDFPKILGFIIAYFLFTFYLSQNRSTVKINKNIFAKSSQSYWRRVKYGILKTVICVMDFQYKTKLRWWISWLPYIIQNWFSTQN